MRSGPSILSVLQRPHQALLCEPLKSQLSGPDLGPAPDVFMWDQLVCVVPLLQMEMS